ncbi:MAG: DUF4348 domain-containing protein [Acidobacteria bacterium]|nr:DUF4348 domain-containing protein [Acidobacteriota bacterium]
MEKAMKINPALLLIFALIFPFSNVVGQTQAKEKFSEFFATFSSDKEFQLERIQFPLVKIVLAVDPQPLGDFIEETVQVDRSDWKHNDFHYNSDGTYRVQIFDNFEAKLFEAEPRETDERVFAYLGIESGFQMYYYFRRIDGKWYLVKIKDWSIL